MKWRRNRLKPHEPPQSLAGKFFLSLALGQREVRAQLIPILYSRIPNGLNELAPVFEAAFASILEKCFSRPPDEQTVARFVDIMLGPFADIDDFGQDLERRFVQSMLASSRFPTEMSLEDAIGICTIFSYVIVRRYGLPEDYVRKSVVRAEKLAIAGGHRLVMDE